MINYVRVEEMSQATGWIAMEEDMFIPDSITPNKFYDFTLGKMDVPNINTNPELGIVDNLGRFYIPFGHVNGHFVRKVEA